MLQSYSSALALTDFEYLHVNKADHDNIQPEPPDCQGLHFLKRLMCLHVLALEKRRCRVISTKCKEAYDLKVKKERCLGLDTSDKELKDQFTKITKTSSLPHYEQFLLEIQ